jgi:hypothetical protein
MDRSRLAAMAAGLGYVVEGMLALAHRLAGADNGWYHHGLDAAYAVAVLGVAVVLQGLSAVLGLGRLGRISARVAQAGCVGMGVESGASAIAGRIDALGPLFGIGILAALVGLVVVAVDGVRAGRVRWGAPLPLLALVVAAAGGEVGASIVAGIAWWALAAWVLDGGRAAEGAPSAAPAARTRLSGA